MTVSPMATPIPFPQPHLSRHPHQPKRNCELAPAECTDGGVCATSRLQGRAKRQTTDSGAQAVRRPGLPWSVPPAFVAPPQSPPPPTIAAGTNCGGSGTNCGTGAGAGAAGTALVVLRQQLLLTLLLLLLCSSCAAAAASAAAAWLSPEAPHSYCVTCRGVLQPAGRAAEGPRAGGRQALARVGIVVEGGNCRYLACGRGASSNRPRQTTATRHRNKPQQQAAATGHSNTSRSNTSHSNKPQP